MFQPQKKSLLGALSIMGNNNSNLHAAKNTKDDEFYTTYETISKELIHYTRHFQNKIVLCNCDDPYESNFCRYFLRNFNLLGLKRLICTSYYTSSTIDTPLPLFDFGKKSLAREKGCVLDVSKFCDITGEISQDYIDKLLKTAGLIKELSGNGDFRSPECLEYLKTADIIVTNPPFSLFKELVSLIIQNKKNFLLIGNQNALTYKEIFPLIQNNQVWTGYHFGEMKFRVPADSEPRETRYWIDKGGQKWRSLGNAMWLTNLDIERRHNLLRLSHKYSPELYPKYDLYDAINISKVSEIPCDYAGIMGVPITIIDKYNSAQFEIIGEANHGSDNEYDLFKPTIKGKYLFKKILVRLKKPQVQRIPYFRILDLFSGAGGLSHGMESNPDFKTVVASDYDEQAITTFKYNMPDAQTVVGDITNTEIKKRIIALSRQHQVNMIVGGPPCQGFSLKGKKLGLNDPRNYLFNEYLSIVAAIKPSVFVIENVKAILSTSAGWFRDQIISKVRSMGYYVSYGVLNSMFFGVPQSRQRAVFICSLEKIIPLPIQNENCPRVTVRDAISDLAYLQSGEGAFEQEYLTKPLSQYQMQMRVGSSGLYNHIASNHAEIALQKLAMIPPECGKECLPLNMRGKQQFSGTWGRLKWDDVSPTIDTRFDASSNGTNNHPVLNRAITPREAARLQSFEDKFVFLGKKVSVRTQIGNAVPPLLARAIADQIQKELNIN